MKTSHPIQPIRFVILFFPFLFFASQKLNAQFILNGSATQTLDTCWTLTTAQNNLVGSIWNEVKIDLNESFQVLMQLNMGTKDADGADGVVFGFQPVSTSVGQVGEGIGFQGVVPSLGIEFDTWQNFNLNDPAFDHMAIIKNGNLNHGGPNTLAGPIQASPTSQNIEDGDWHQLRVDWDATANTLEVWFDCEHRLSYTGDIVNEIFGGDPEVFWGFTSATGGANNLHQVCLAYTTFLDGFEDVVICPGGQLQLQIGGGSSYHWMPETGLSNPNIPNPIASPEETTTYVVEVTDPCNNPILDSLTVFVDGDTVFFELGVDTTFCEPNSLFLDATSTGTDTVTYQWSNGMTSPSINASSSGLYSVTVTIDEYCRADDRVSINVLPLPGNIDLGNDMTLCLEQDTILVATTSGNPSYLWSDGSTADTLLVDAPGNYSVSISNECGTNEDFIFIEYEDCRQIYFPNVFSPNGDGINDVFYPFHGGDVLKINTLKIYDRWGGLVFENNNFPASEINHGWNGTARGKKSGQGVYVWFAEVEFRDRVTVFFEGEVNLID